MEVDQLAPLSSKLIKNVQNIVGTLLYYARVVEPTLSAALSEIAPRQVKGTEYVLTDFHQMLNYAASHSHTAIRFWTVI